MAMGRTVSKFSPWEEPWKWKKYWLAHYLRLRFPARVEALIWFLHQMVTAFALTPQMAVLELKLQLK